MCSTVSVRPSHLYNDRSCREVKEDKWVIKRDQLEGCTAPPERRKRSRADHEDGSPGNMADTAASVGLGVAAAEPPTLPLRCCSHSVEVPSDESTNSFEGIREGRRRTVGGCSAEGTLTRSGTTGCTRFFPSAAGRTMAVAAVVVVLAGAATTIGVEEEEAARVVEREEEAEAVDAVELNDSFGTPTAPSGLSGGGRTACSDLATGDFCGGDVCVRQCNLRDWRCGWAKDGLVSCSQPRRSRASRCGVLLPTTSRRDCGKRVQPRIDRVRSCGVLVCSVSSSTQPSSIRVCRLGPSK